MSSNYPRGSEWRKWDLHVHTPLTRLANRYDGHLKAFARKVGEEQLAVVGCTNYYCLVDNEVEQIRDALTAEALVATVFPNVEFRIAHPNDAGVYINIHVIFSDQLSTAEINTSLSRLQLINTTNEDRSIYCSEQSIQENGVGFDNILVHLPALIEQLQNDFQPGRDFVVGALPRGHGDFRPAHGDGRGSALAVEIDKKCHFMFGTIGDVEFYLNDPRRADLGPKPVFAHSDAHDLASVGQRFTWIKADPTFAGLIQTVYEPEERVRIQDDSPFDDYLKPFFSHIRANGPVMVDGVPSYDATDMPLNPNLVTIIGGRGTGKSLLLDTLFLTFDQEESISDLRLDRLSAHDFAVDYQKAPNEVQGYRFGDASPLSYLHVRQGDIRSKVESPEKLSREIKRLLRISSADDVSEFDFELANLLEKIAKRRSWFSQEDTNGDYVNTEGFNQRKVQENKALIETITTESNRELISQYSENAKAINDKRQIQSKIGQLKSITNSAKSEVGLAVERVNELIPDNQKLPNMNFEPLGQSATALSQHVDADIQALVVQNDQISQKFKDQGIDQDVAGLLAKVDQYQKAIDDGNAALKLIEAQTKQLDKEVADRNEFAEIIKNELDVGTESINSRFQSLKAGSDSWDEEQKSLVGRLLGDINVSGGIDFDIDKFYEGLSVCLNGRKFRSTNSETQADRIRQKLGVKNYDDYLDLIKGEAIIDDDAGGKQTLNEFAQDSDYFMSAEYDIFEHLYLYRHRLTYLAVSAEITYKGKLPEKLSVGQRGTFYVSMKLATDPFGSPFVFDQPEDDLDNEFIMSELVPIFQDIKKYRQVIIATHNANLVVNADAEQVVVANNYDEVLSYESGSLEHTLELPDKGIREHVCTILEGGKDAFENRELKYGFRPS